jgi:hypothetical protein
MFAVRKSSSERSGYVTRTPATVANDPGKGGERDTGAGSVSPVSDRPKFGVHHLIAAGIALFVVVGLASLLDGGGSGDSVGSTSDDGIEQLQDVGVPADQPFGWAYSTTCAQFEETGPEGKRALAVELSDEVNSPLGNAAAVDALLQTIPDTCAGAAPEFEPGGDAVVEAEYTTGAK